MRATVHNGVIVTNEDLSKYEGKDLEITIIPKGRTAQQNKALHVFFTLLADELNEHGFDMKEIIHVDIPWDAYTVKNFLWRPLQKVMLGKKSTKQLKTNEIDKVYDVLNKVIAERTNGNIHIPFPSNEKY